MTTGQPQTPDSPAFAPAAEPLQLGEALLAAGWGFAEGTLFFIVPDVLLTRIAVTSGGKSAVQASVCALAGSIGGGLLIYLLASHGHAQALMALFAHIPGISAQMIASTGDLLQHDGLARLFHGAFTGIPYKLYALHAGRLSLNPLGFLGVSLLARFSRFALSSLVAAWLSRLFPRSWTMRTRLGLHLVFWVVFYAVFFYVRREAAA